MNKLIKLLCVFNMSLIFLSLFNGIYWLYLLYMEISGKYWVVYSSWSKLSLTLEVIFICLIFLSTSLLISLWFLTEIKNRS